MPFLTPTPPPVDVEEWKRLPHLERIKPLAQDWAVNGFGTPTAVYLLYVVKLIVFVVGGAAADLGHDAGPRRPRRHRRLVDRADRLPEGRRLDDALGDPRARLPARCR